MPLSILFLILQCHLVSATWENSFETLTDHVSSRAPLLLINEVGDLDGNGGYVNELLSKFGHDEKSLENIMTAIDVKYGKEGEFTSGWLTAKQRNVLLTQFTAFYTAMGIDDPKQNALDKLNKVDRTVKRNEAFDEADTNRDERLSIEEIKVLFRRRPKIRRGLFIMSTDDKLHNVTKEDRSEFSLLRYDADGKYSNANGSTVVDISIPPPSFKPVSLYLSRSPLSKTPKQVFFNPINIFLLSVL